MHTWLAVGFLAACLPLAFAANEAWAQELAKAPRELAEPSWPRNPDRRLSSLSGKMRNTLEINPKDFGKSQEFPTRRAEVWQKESPLVSQPTWEGNQARRWDHARWNQAKVFKDAEKDSEKFSNSEKTLPKTRSHAHQLSPEAVSEWSARTSKMTTVGSESPRLYEGRLTRVREQVWRETQNTRDLGKGRQEKFSPDEVDKMLAQPVGEFGEAVRE